MGASTGVSGTTTFGTLSDKGEASLVLAPEDEAGKSLDLKASGTLKLMTVESSFASFCSSLAAAY
jgi:hypothetical protein